MSSTRRGGRGSSLSSHSHAFWDIGKNYHQEEVDDDEGGGGGVVFPAAAAAGDDDRNPSAYGHGHGHMSELCTYVAPEVIPVGYVEHSDVQALTVFEVEAFKESKQIVTEGVNVPKPIRHFREITLPDYMKLLFKAEGFTSPSPIQCQGWPVALSGRDMVGIAETGSGKTLAFMIPAILHCQAQPPLLRGDGPTAVILTPTRELAQQTHHDFEKYGRRPLRCSVVYGGVPRGPQQRELQQGVELLIGTPGRMLDFLTAKVTNLRRVSFLVFDEADKMLDMGLYPTIREICQQSSFQSSPTTRQTLMFTATWSDDIQQMSKQYLKKETLVKVKIGSADLTVNHNIEQVIYYVSDDTKADRFLAVLQPIYGAESKILVFASTRKRAEALASALVEAGFPVGCLHGDKTQLERDQTLLQFREGKLPLVVATDVAARGLDIKGVDYVINYDLPLNLDSYIHRIGRTGRAGNFGQAISFFTSDDEPLALDLVCILDETQQKVDPWLRDAASRVKAKLVAREEKDTFFTKRRRYNSRGGGQAEPSAASLSFRKIASGSSEPSGSLTMVTPTDSPLEGGNSVSSVAAKSCFGEPSKVLLLRNLVGVGEVDSELEAEVQQECQKYGRVSQMFVYEVTHWSIKSEEAVRIFVRFESVADARQALRKFSGRPFGGRTICASFFPEERFRQRDWEPSPKDPVMPHCVLLRNAVILAHVDDNLQSEITEECSRFGEVRECVIYTNPTSGTPLTEQVRIFVRFAKFEAALTALRALHGRRFGGRYIYACFFDEALVAQRNFDIDELEPEMVLPTLPQLVPNPTALWLPLPPPPPPPPPNTGSDFQGFGSDSGPGARAAAELDSPHSPSSLPPLQPALPAPSNVVGSAKNAAAVAGGKPNNKNSNALAVLMSNYDDDEEVEDGQEVKSGGGGEK